MRITLDGVEYRVGVRWFYGGEHHARPPADARRATRYRVFVPPDFEERGWYRSYAIQPGDPIDADEAELLRELRAAGHCTREQFDSATRNPGPRPL